MAQINENRSLSNSVLYFKTVLVTVYMGNGYEYSPEVLQRLLETFLTWLRWKISKDTYPVELPLAAYDTGGRASANKQTS